METKFRIAESYFELFKSHKSLQREDEKKTDLEAGGRILREVIERMFIPIRNTLRGFAYLLGFQFAQELEQWDEAYTRVQTRVFKKKKKKKKKKKSPQPIRKCA